MSWVETGALGGNATQEGPSRLPGLNPGHLIEPIGCVFNRLQHSFHAGV